MNCLLVKIFALYCSRSWTDFVILNSFSEETLKVGQIQIRCHLLMFFLCLFPEYICFLKSASKNCVNAQQREAIRVKWLEASAFLQNFYGFKTNMLGWRLNQACKNVNYAYTSNLAQSSLAQFSIVTFQSKVSTIEEKKCQCLSKLLETKVRLLVNCWHF